MKKAFIFAICLCLSYALTAQETPKQKEIGLTISPASSLGLTYRTGTSKSMLRLKAVGLSGSSNLEDQSINIRTSVSMGMEFRKDLDTKLEFRYGADLSFGYTYQKYNSSAASSTLKRHTYTPGINMVLGLNYSLNENLFLGVEILPGIGYGRITSYTIEEPSVKSTSDQFTYSLSSNSVLLSIVYRL